MWFQIEHVIEAPPTAVEAALLDPRTLSLLPPLSPVVSSAELLRLEDRGTAVERMARLEARGLPALTGMRLTPETVAWLERVVWRRRVHAASFVIDPLLAPWLRARVHCRGVYRLASRGAATARTVRGEIRVEIPFVGTAIERAIVQLLHLHFAAEARLLGAQTSTRESRRAHAG